MILEGATPSGATNFNNMTKQQQALAHIANFCLKQDDAPCSAQSHLDYAIALLSEESGDWNPQDEEIRKIIVEAREHTAYYHAWAKKPWPNILNAPVA